MKDFDKMTKSQIVAILDKYYEKDEWDWEENCDVDEICKYLYKRFGDGQYLINYVEGFVANPDVHNVPSSCIKDLYDITENDKNDKKLIANAYYYLGKIYGDKLSKLYNKDLSEAYLIKGGMDKSDGKDILVK